MRAVVWTPKAERANRALIAYLTDTADETTARLVHDRILQAAQKLGNVATGRPGRVSGTYEKSVTRTSHVILYDVRRRQGIEYILILDVVHSRRNWRADEMPPA